MGFLFKDGFFDNLFKKSKKVEKVKSDSTFNYFNVEVESVGLQQEYGTYETRYQSTWRHIVSLTNDHGAYKAGSRFSKRFTSIMFRTEYSNGSLKYTLNEKFMINLNTWERV